MKKVKILYGGSVNPKNIQQLKIIDNIDGFLVGELLKILKNLLI